MNILVDMMMIKTCLAHI